MIWPRFGGEAASWRHLSNSRRTFATRKPLFQNGVEIVAKLTLCATMNDRLGADRQAGGGQKPPVERYMRFTSELSINATLASMNKQKTGIGLLICVSLLIALGAPVLSKQLGPGVTREAMWWAIAAITVGYVLLIERKGLASIGLVPPRLSSFAFGFATAVFMIATVVAIFKVIFPLFGLQMNRSVVEQIANEPVWFRALMFLRASVVEEILYRGYAIERIETLTGSKWFAFAASVVVFTGAHWYGWGGAQLVVVASGGLILGLLYLWRRDLVCNMIAHFLVDFVSFFAASVHH